MLHLNDGVYKMISYLHKIVLLFFFKSKPVSLSFAVSPTVNAPSYLSFFQISTGCMAF